MDRGSQLDEDDEDDEEDEEDKEEEDEAGGGRRRKEEEDEEEEAEATNIKSNNPHLAGGELYNVANMVNPIINVLLGTLLVGRLQGFTVYHIYPHRSPLIGDALVP